MNLLCLAPDIQEALLFLPATKQGCDVIMEKRLRRVAAERTWRKQRELWRERGVTAAGATRVTPT